MSLYLYGSYYDSKYTQTKIDRRVDTYPNHFSTSNKLDCNTFIADFSVYTVCDYTEA
jgi:hypothetical protein